MTSLAYLEEHTLILYSREQWQYIVLGHRKGMKGGYGRFLSNYTPRWTESNQPTRTPKHSTRSGQGYNIQSGSTYPSNPSLLPSMGPENIVIRLGTST
jgi:hypothetical protein